MALSCPCNDRGVGQFLADSDDEPPLRCLSLAELYRRDNLMKDEKKVLRKQPSGDGVGLQPKHWEKPAPQRRRWKGKTTKNKEEGGSLASSPIFMSVKDEGGALQGAQSVRMKEEQTPGVGLRNPVKVEPTERADQGGFHMPAPSAVKETLFVGGREQPVGLSRRRLFCEGESEEPVQQGERKRKLRARIKQEADGEDSGLASAKAAHVGMSNVGSSEGLPADISNLRAVKLEAGEEDSGLAGGGTAPVETIDLGSLEEEEPVQLLECACCFRTIPSHSPSYPCGAGHRFCGACIYERVKYVLFQYDEIKAGLDCFAGDCKNDISCRVIEGALPDPRLLWQLMDRLTAKVERLEGGKQRLAWCRHCKLLFEVGLNANVMRNRDSFNHMCRDTCLHCKQDYKRGHKAICPAKEQWIVRGAAKEGGPKKGPEPRDGKRSLGKRGRLDEGRVTTQGKKRGSVGNGARVTGDGGSAFPGGPAVAEGSNGTVAGIGGSGSHGAEGYQESGLRNREWLTDDEKRRLEREEELTAALLSNCPNPTCRTAFEIDKGCNNIRCKRCGLRFSYICNSKVENGKRGYERHFCKCKKGKGSRRKGAEGLKKRCDLCGRCKKSSRSKESARKNREAVEGRHIELDAGMA